MSTPGGLWGFKHGWATIGDVEEHSRDADFVELHADRLFGFAMIVTLGDATRAGKLAAEALAKGIQRIDQLRHPVRAAAWLRGTVTKAAGRPAWGHQRPSEVERRDALHALGVDADDLRRIGEPECPGAGSGGGHVGRGIRRGGRIRDRWAAMKGFGKRAATS